MYEALLDEVEEEPTAHADVAAALVGKEVVTSGANEEAQNPPTVDGDSDAKEEEDDDEGLPKLVDQESWSDDPVRMYLTQMGEIPLLTRKEEISLARRIEVTRSAFRCRLLECDYVIRVATKILNRVHRG